MKFPIMNSTDTKDFKATSHQSWLFLERASRGKRVHTPHSKMRDTFNGLSRSLYITAKSHECEQVLDPDYIPKESEKEVLNAKQIFCCI